MAEVWSVKIGDEEKERLSQLIEKSGLSSKDFLSNMITTYELSKVKEATPLLKEDIDELQMITNRINNIYSNIGDRIQTLLNNKERDYEKKIEDKQITISLMNEKNIELSTQREDDRKQILILKQENEELHKQLINEIEMKETSQSLVMEYKNKICLMENDMQEQKVIREENKSLQSKINDIILENEKLQINNTDLKKNIEEMKKKHEDKITSLNNQLSLQNEKEKLKLKEDYQNKIQELQEQYNKKVQELLEMLEQKDKNKSKS